MTEQETFKTTVEIALPAKRYLDFYEAIARLKGVTVAQAIGETLVQDAEATKEELQEIWEERDRWEAQNQAARA